MRFAAIFCILLMVAGCGANTGATSNAIGKQTPPPAPPAPAPSPPPAPPAPPALPPPAAGTAVSDSGSVNHASTPIAGARVYLFAANTTGYGNVSVSLLNPALTGTSDAIGAYVTSASDGSFSMKGDYTCVPNTQVYMYAVGGNTGSGNAVGLLALLGSCPSGGNFGSTSSAVWVNEVSTAAAAYAMAGFASDSTHVSSSGTALAQIGIANAFANAANLSNITSGAALTTTPAGNGTVPQSLINTLANILAACVGSTVAAPTSTNSACSTLFANATADGTTTGAQSTETATAAINIAHHPGVNVAALFALSANSFPFSPGLTAPPNDYTIALSFTAGGLVQGPTGIAIDGSGNVWITNNSSNSVTELSSVGAPLSPSTGYTGGGLQGPIGIAIDDSGNAWVANRSGNSITELSTSGAPVSPSTGFIGGGLTSPFSIAIDASGNVWAVEGGNNANEGVIAELSNVGVPISPPTGFSSAAQLTPTYLAVDPSSSLWLETELNSIAEVSSGGTLVGNNNVFEGGTQCNQADEIGGIAIDALGNKWSKSAFGVTKFSTSPSPICAQIGNSGGVDFQNWIGADSTPGAIAIDGSGNVWDLSVGNISEISGSLVPISPLNGYQPLGLPTPVSIAIDGSGNVWLSGGNRVSELVGTATPVVTPLATGVKNNTLASRP
jgi:hypothetical protein